MVYFTSNDPTSECSHRTNIFNDWYWFKRFRKNAEIHWSIVDNFEAQTRECKHHNNEKQRTTNWAIEKMQGSSFKHRTAIDIQFQFSNEPLINLMIFNVIKLNFTFISRAIFFLSAFPPSSR